MGHINQRDLAKKAFNLKEKGANMHSGIIISLLLGLAICLIEVKGQCECTTRTAVINDGKRTKLGNCLTGDFGPGPNNGRKFCYVKGKYGVDDCCEAKTSRFVNLCVNYDLCDEDDDDDVIEPDDKTEKIVDPRFGA